MKTFFLQLFLSFWLAAVGILIGSTVLFPGSNPGPVENFRAAGQASSTRIVDDSLREFCVQGAHMRFHLFVLTRCDL